MASAILAMKYPKKYAIIDKNVLEALHNRRHNTKRKSIPTNFRNEREREKAIELYEEYMKILKKLKERKREFKGKSFREIEIKLFEEGRKNKDVNRIRKARGKL